MTEFYAAGKRFPLNRTYVMGILNVTPDSFSDGGKYFDPEKAVRHAVEMEAQGVDIVDIGGQSTRPGSVRISPEEEWARIENVVKAVAEKTNLAISIDTFYPEVAEKSLKAGAHIINDVTGFAPEMWRAVENTDCGCIVSTPAIRMNLTGRGAAIFWNAFGHFSRRKRRKRNSVASIKIAFASTRASALARQMRKISRLSQTRRKSACRVRHF